MEPNKPLKNLVNQVFVALSTLILCILLLEIGLRIIGRVPTNTISGLYEQDGESYRLKKNMKKIIKWPGYVYTTFTNSYGFRDKINGDPKIENKPYYIFLGASEVFGNGVDYENSFVGIIDAFGTKHGVKIINMAIAGHYFLDQERIFKDHVRKSIRKPGKVFFCLNALHIPKFNLKNDNVIEKNGELINKENWRITYIRLILGNISSAYCFFRDNIRKVQSKYFNHRPTNKSNEFLRIYSKSNRMHDPKNIKLFEEYLDSFNEYCYKNNITPIYVYTPITDSYRLPEILSSIGESIENYDTAYYERLMDSYCKRNQIKFINLRPVLQTYFDQGTELRFKLDPHYNKFANRILGEYLIKEIF